MALGLEDVLVAAGGRYSSAFVPYHETIDPATAEATAMALKTIAPDVDGQLNVGHPEASEALATYAANSGADVRRGVRDVQVTAGDAPEVSWTEDGGRARARCRLVVGADGRSSIVRRQLGIELEERPAGTYCAGLLVRTPDGLQGVNAFGSEGDNCFIAFPRSDDLSRLYLIVDGDRQPEFSGPGRTERFLSAYAAECFPASKAYAAAEVAGPCCGSPLSDSWTVGPPVVPGAVLTGDSAGWNDPVIGQGLSVALRDVRMVSDILLASSDWSVPAFDGWVEERRERMRRLLVAAHVQTRLRCDFTPEGRRRRRVAFDSMFVNPQVLAQIGSSLIGPEAFPPDAFSDEAVAATVALG